MADLIVGAVGANGNAGSSYVVFGKTGNAAISLGALGTGGFVINGQAANDQSGASVSSAGDVNGDGLADLIVGASKAGGTGRSYVVFGKTGTLAINLSSLTSGTSTDGFVINGQAASDNSGKSVSSAGDVNGDGLADLIVGADLSDPNTTDLSNAGRCYVVFGKSANTAAINLISLTSGSSTDGFVINGHLPLRHAQWCQSGVAHSQRRARLSQRD